MSISGARRWPRCWSVRSWCWCAASPRSPPRWRRRWGWRRSGSWSSPALVVGAAAPAVPLPAAARPAERPGAAPGGSWPPASSWPTSPAASHPSTPRSRCRCWCCWPPPTSPAFLPAEQLIRFVWRLLSFYVALTFFYQLVAEPAVVARGYEGIVRYDPTGSVVMHSSLSLIHLIVAVARLGQPISPARPARDPGPGRHVPVHGVPDRDPDRSADAGDLRRAVPADLAPPRPGLAPPGRGGPGPRARVRRLDARGQRQLLAAAGRRPGRLQLRPLGLDRPLADAGRRPSLGPGPGRSPRAAGRRTAGAGRRRLPGMAAQRVRAALCRGRAARAAVRRAAAGGAGPARRARGAATRPTRCCAR